MGHAKAAQHQEETSGSVSHSLGGSYSTFPNPETTADLQILEMTVFVLAKDLHGLITKAFSNKSFQPSTVFWGGGLVPMGLAWLHTPNTPTPALRRRCS
jgi:hypothetical protein